MKRLKTFLFMVFAGLLLTGCASVAYVEKDDTVNFSNYKTYTWVDTKEKEESKGANSLTEQHIRKAVDEELARQGWRKSSNQPDVLLSYDVLVERALKQNREPVYTQPFTRTFYNPYTRRWGYIYYPSRFAGYDRIQYEVQEGTVTISMIDAASEKTVWQGWTTDEMASRNLTGKEIQASVKSIFRKFDVAAK
ncbi:MAG: DUF4136 domain-containing protein [Chitinophagaceae bacterium]